jgi:hypothetical protein
VAVGGTDTYAIDIFQSKTTLSQRLIFVSVDVEQFGVRLTQKDALNSRGCTMNLGSEGEKIISLMLPAFSFSWNIWIEMGSSLPKL